MENIQETFQKNKIIFELFIYFVYIYLLLFLFLIIKPTLITLLIFNIYCFYTTWQILTNNINNTSKILKNKYFRFIFVFIYSLFCILVYYFLHIYWIKLIKYSLFKIVLIFAPLLYFLLIKIVGYIFILEPYYNINYGMRNPFYHILDIIDLIKKTLIY